MIITYHGLDTVKLQYGNTSLVFNPRSKGSNYGQVKGAADVMLSSINHIDYAPDDAFGSPDDDTLKILGPGAYGRGELMIKGLAAPMKYEDTEYHGSIYLFDLEDVRVCFCGPLADTKLSEETQEHLSQVELLFVPVGGGDVLDPADAYEFAVSLEPSLIIPTHYGAHDSEKDAVKTFVKEGGTTEVNSVDKLTLKKREILEKQAEVVVLDVQK